MSHTFEQKLRETIKSWAIDTGSAAPDFILASFMIDCLDAFTEATKARDEYYSSGKTPPQEQKP
jgi:hypothetical protein